MNLFKNNKMGDFDYSSDIIRNLQDFYRFSCENVEGKCGDFKGAYFVNGGIDQWPSALIGSIEEKELSLALKAISEKTLPPFWIVDKKVDSKFYGQLKLKNFYEVTRWTGMSLLKSDFRSTPNMNKTIQIKAVETMKEMKSWLDLLYKSLLKQRKISSKLAQEWMNSENILLLGAYKCNALVSIGLAFVEHNKAGLYFIATEDEYSRQGIATALVIHLIHWCFDRGASPVLLQSSEKGFHLYEKLGFKGHNEISVFWKLGQM